MALRLPPPFLRGLNNFAPTIRLPSRHICAFSTTATPHARQRRGFPLIEKVSASSPSKGGTRKRAKYQYRSPRYYRGRLAPNLPPPPASPASRLFTPGPFTSERLEDHYYNTLEPDLQILSYVHQLDPKFDRQRALPPGRALRTFRNMPKLRGITVHSMARGALNDSAYLHAAGMVVQSITGVRATPHKSKENIAFWDLRAGKAISVTARVKGRAAYRFMAQLIDVVLPRIKDWKGVSGKSGDSAGNISFGLTPDAVSLFPEIEANYDMYPPKMVPGIHITIHTSAGNDVDAKILLKSMGLPFYGNFH